MATAIQESEQRVEKAAARPAKAKKASYAVAEVPPASRDELLKLDNQLCFPLYACAKEVVRRYTPFLDELGITYTQYITLMALWEADGMSVGQLGKRLYLDSGTLTPLLKKMEQRGLVERRRDEADERRVCVFLTDEGTALKQRAYDVPLQVGACMSMDSEDALQLWTLLHKTLDMLVPPEE